MPSKVIQGHQLRYQWKAQIFYTTSEYRNSNLHPISHCFHSNIFLCYGYATPNFSFAATHRLDLGGRCQER